MTPPSSTLVVGGGIAGLSTAWWLARGGLEQVVLLERDAQLASRSSALNAAILRTVDPDASLTALAERSARFLRTPPDGFCEHPLVDPCGLVLTATIGAEAAELESWVAHCSPASEAEELDPTRLARLTPYYSARDQRAWLFPHEGRLDVAHICDSFARGARAAGASILNGAEGHVAELLVEDAAVRGVVRADGSVLRADVVVLAAGGWAGRLGHAAGSRLALTPTRRHLLVTEPDPSIDTSWPVVWRHGDAFYCRPESGGMLVCGCDQALVVDPDTLERDATVLETIAEKTARNVPMLADAGAAHWWCGMRTLTPSGRFAIGYDADVEGLFWVAGLGGHGMTSGAEVGRMAATLLAGEREPAAAGFAPRAHAATAS